MRKALIASLFLVCGACAGSSVAIRAPLKAPYDQTAMVHVPADFVTVEPGFGTEPAAYGWHDLGATPPCTLADVR